MTEERPLPGRKSRNRNWRRRDDGTDAVQGDLLGWTDDAVASEPHVVNKLRAIRGPGESYSDVILRLAGDASENGPPIAATTANQCDRALPRPT